MAEHAHRRAAPPPGDASLEHRETFAIPLDVAERYEARFVPALFAEWAPHVVALAGVGAGDAVLDVACGTGIVARTAAERVGDGGHVIGVDCNDAMLAVARRVRPELDWRSADVAALPFADGTFDAVLCQMAMMFFPDRVGALREMGRVARPGARVAVVVPAALDAQAAWGPFVDVAVDLVGPDAAALLGAYWSCGDLDRLAGQARDAGLRVVARSTRTGTARYDSVDDFVTTEVGATPLAARLDADALARLCAASVGPLAPFTTASGAVEAPLVGHLLAAVRG